MCIKTGFLVTNNAFCHNEKKYYGVDTNPWEIWFKDCSFYSPNIREKYNWESVMLSDEFVFLLKAEHANLYFENYRKKVNDARLLYCICTLEENIHALKNIQPTADYTFLGYDYAYGGGDYYSAILNDVMIRHTLFQNRFALNKYGLLSSTDIMYEFIYTRSEINRLVDNPMLFESGNFIVYKIYDATP